MAKTYVLEMIRPIIASQGLPSSAVVSAHPSHEGSGPAPAMNVNGRHWPLTRSSACDSLLQILAAFLAFLYNL